MFGPVTASRAPGSQDMAVLCINRLERTETRDASNEGVNGPRRMGRGDRRLHLWWESEMRQRQSGCDVVIAGDTFMTSRDI